MCQKRPAAAARISRSITHNGQGERSTSLPREKIAGEYLNRNSNIGRSSEPCCYFRTFKSYTSDPPRDRFGSQQNSTQKKSFLFSLRHAASVPFLRIRETPLKARVFAPRGEAG